MKKNFPHFVRLLIEATNPIQNMKNKNLILSFLSHTCIARLPFKNPLFRILAYSMEYDVMIQHFLTFLLFFFVSVFGIGSMIYSGIEIGMFFELNMDETANCKNLFSVIRPLLQMVFVFVQMYFVFLNHKMNIYKNKFMSRIGLMHMIATNICVW